MPALTLLLITPVLTELLTGNTPAPGFFLPRMFCSLMLFYGVPAILARDLFIRWNLRLPGLFLIGLAYGIFNEGVLAKTLLMNKGVPIDAFDHYAWFGINFPWAALIVPWHACHAIIFPIALVAWWFPARSRTPSLSRGAFAVVAVGISVLGALAYLGNKERIAPTGYLVLFSALMATLILLAGRIRHGEPFLDSASATSFWPAAAGFTFYPVLVMGPTILCALKAPGFVVFAGAIVILCLYQNLLARRQWLGLTSFVLFALGSYLAGAVFTSLLMKGAVMTRVPYWILAAIFLIGIASLRKRIIRVRRPDSSIK